MIDDCELPSHITTKQHASYDEKPAVQVLNEQLTDEHPTGYKPHAEPCEIIPDDSLPSEQAEESANVDEVEVSE